MRLIDADALEFEPDENCIANGVLIWGSRSGDKTMTTVLYALKEMINNAPAVDAVEVVHGRWNMDEEMYAWNCSVCRSISLNGRRYSYCHNCGAKMDGDGND